MLSKTETEGCRRILDKLNYQDLLSLVDTTTRKQIKVSRTSEAIKAILEYTPSALELLKRKKVKREFLFSYLADEKVVVQPFIDKAGLIVTILKRWGTDLQDFEQMMVDLDDDSNAPQEAADPGSLARLQGNQPQPNTRNGNQPQPSTSQDTGARNQGTGNQQARINIQYNVNQYINVSNIKNETNTTYTGDGVSSGNSAIVGPGTPGMTSACKAENDATDVVSAEVQTLGLKFAEWFYENLNSHCPCMQKAPGDFGPHHFWDDAYLVLNSCTPDPNVDKIAGAFLVSQRFLAFAKEEHLLFNPNLTKDGIYVKSDPHGLVMILVCGTVHRNNDCLGVFQQIFGIVKDPRFENNWKIKMTKLEVNASKTTAIPKLEGNLDRQIMAF